MTDSPPIEPTPSRSRIPRVGTLIVLTLVVAAIALFLTVVLPYQRQMAAIEHIHSLGRIAFTEPVGPVWLRECVGEERMQGFDRVDGVVRLESLILTKFADDDLRAIAVFSELSLLDLRFSQITDSGLKELEKIKSLKQLDLSQTKITDAGLKHLYGLSKLEEIWLFNTQVTGNGVRELQIALPKCIIKSNFGEALEDQHL